MTDAKRQYVYGIPDGADVNNTPYIRIGCYGAKDTYPMGVSIFWNQPLSKKYADSNLSLTTVMFRLNQQEPFNMVWNMTADQSVTYPPDDVSGAMSTIGDAIIGSILPSREVAEADWSASELHFTMLNAERVVFRAYALRGRDITVTFTMDGYREAVASFAGHCGGVIDPTVRKAECERLGVPDGSRAMKECLTNPNYRR